MTRATLLAVLALGCAARTRPPVPAPPPPPADPLAGATARRGFVTFWRKDDKLWLGVAARALEVPFLFCWEQTRGMGEHEPRLNGGNAGPCLMATFHRNGRQLQLRAQNTRYMAAPGTPEAAAVKQSFTESLIGAAPLMTPTPAPASAQGMLVADAGPLLLADIPELGTHLEETYRQPYAFDVASSGFGRVRVGPGAATVEVSAHYKVNRVVLAPLESRVPRPASPVALVDDRSLFLGLQYRFIPLPPAYVPRRADDRLGHLILTRYDYSNDLRHDPRIHQILRWRLERADAADDAGKPRRPLTYWLDASIPARYRKTVREAILEWNGVFEQIGFRDAIVVRDLPAGEPEPLELPHALVRWFVQADGDASARGGLVFDPRTGEILHAHILIPDNWARGLRSAFLEGRVPPSGDADADACAYASAAGEDLAFALALLDARQGVAPDSPEAEAMVQAVLKEVVMHETGHTLGLTHNFRASTLRTQDELDDPELTRERGIAASVMDYNPINLAPRGRRQGVYAMTHPGPYDAWALEYAYRTFSPGEEKEALARLAARSGEPALAFSNDADAGPDDLTGVDPEVNRRDLGRDALAYARRRFALSRELWGHLAGKKLLEGEAEDGLRRSFDRAFGGVGHAARLAAKHVGGVVHVRDHAGGRPPFAPVPAARQRQALALLESEVFSPEAFRFPPALLNRLTVDPLVWRSADPAYRLYNTAVSLQDALLAHLLGPAVAERLVEMEARAPAGQALTVGELYGRLLASVWAELRAGAAISPLRRALQREHLDLLERMALRPPPRVPEDVRSLARANLRTLVTWLHRARPAGLSPEARAHVDDSLAQATRALTASLQLAPR
jgi:hypothetical protein